MTISFTEVDFTPVVFTCGRRPTGHRVIQIVVVVVGGEHLLYMGTGRAHVWSCKNHSITLMLCFFYYFKGPCMVWMPMYARGVPLHSEIMV